jgi:adenine-specific DNA-methyltransferase
MEKLKMHSPDLVAGNIEKIAALFPNCITEAKGADGKMTRAVDFDLLKQELSGNLVEGAQERYRLDWPGKREALLAANAPIAKTLRPFRNESIAFDTSENIFIEGDNLEALKLLQESYLEKIKLIFIDPPYNTGRDFIYDDDYSEDADTYLERSNQVGIDGGKLVTNTDANGRFHSDWASMLYPRLKLARNLLKEDGVIFVTLDDHEIANLRKLMDEVFGEDNFVASIIWQKVYAPKNTADWFSEDHDYVVVYARNKALWRPEKLARTPEMEARYKNPDNDSRGPWKAADMSARNRYDAGVYPVKCPSGRIIDGPPTGRYWAIDEKKFKALDADNRIWWGADGDNAPAVKRFLSEVSSGRTPQTLWTYQEVGHTQDAKKTLLKYVPFENTENVLNSVKPVELIQRILQLSGKPDENSIVLDFFSGSASTAHAVLKQNYEDGGSRRFIAIQIQEALPVSEKNLNSIFEMGLTRINSYIEELKKTEPLASKDAKLGYRVFRVDVSNYNDVYYKPDKTTQTDLLSLTDNIRADRTPEDLLFQVMLDWGVDLGLPICSEMIAGKKVFVVDGNALAACFDTEISEELVTALAKRRLHDLPLLKVVFRDAGYASDSAKINVEQIFKLLSPTTELRTL